MNKIFCINYIEMIYFLNVIKYILIKKLINKYKYMKGISKKNSNLVDIITPMVSK